MSSETLRFLQQENVRLQEENAALRAENVALRGYVSALEELHRITQDIISEEDLFELLDKILFSAMTIVGAEDGSLMLLDEETNELEFVLVHSSIQQQLLGYRIPAGQGIAGWTIVHHEPLIVNTPRQDRRFSQQVDTEFNFSTNSLIAVPMAARDNVIGVIELLNKRHGEEFAEPDVSLLLILAHIAAAALLEMEERLAEEESADAPSFE